MRENKKKVVKEATLISNHSFTLDISSINIDPHSQKVTSLNLLFFAFVSYRVIQFMLLLLVLLVKLPIQYCI